MTKYMSFCVYFAKYLYERERFRVKVTVQNETRVFMFNIILNTSYVIRRFPTLYSQQFHGTGKFTPEFLYFQDQRKAGFNSSHLQNFAYSRYT